MASLTNGWKLFSAAALTAAMLLPVTVMALTLTPTGARSR